jgi:hypothetical protein
VVNYRLDLYNEQGSPTIALRNCPVMERLPIDITLQIAEVRTPDKAMGSASKTIQIPGTTEVHKFFESVYDPNINLQDFNPGLKIKAYYYVDELLQFNGDLQIVKIKVQPLSRIVIYECQIVGEVLTVMNKVKDLYLTDLDFSTYNHNLTFTDITNSWTGTCDVAGTPTAVGAGVGYRYPMADLGTNNSNLSVMRPTDFQPVLFKRQILEKIFTNAGYTWTSTYLDSVEFKAEVMPPTEPMKLSSSALANNKFLAKRTTQQAAITIPSALVNTVKVVFGDANPYPAEFPTEVYDAGGNYDNTTFQFTVPVTQKYNIQGSLGLKFVVTRDTGSGPVDVNANITPAFTSGVHIKIYESNSSTTIGTYDLDILTNTLGSLATTQYNGQIQLNNVQLIAGQIYYIIIVFPFGGVQVQHNFGVATGTWALNTYVQADSNFSAEFASTDMYEGAVVTMNDALPKLYKQGDFITDLRKEKNLYFMQDKDNPLNIIIEPRPTFYNTNVLDWTKKLDRKAPVEEFLMGELDFIQLIGKHAEDGDYFNKIYVDEFKEPYGTKTLDIENDFIKNTKTIQTTTAATPYYSNPATGLVVPTMVKRDNNTITSTKVKPRSWYWSGVVTMPIGLSWKFKYNNDANFVVYNTMPMAGHTDNPWNPTIDLSWSVPKRVYFFTPNQQWTTNNLYNKWYSQGVNEITDPNSKLIRCQMYLTAKDIAEFDFRRPIETVIDRNHVICLVNKIEGYNPQVKQTCTVELLKLTAFDTFVPAVIDTELSTGNAQQNVYKIGGNNIENSPNSYNYGNDSMITGGSGNFINLNSNAQLINCNNVVVLGNVEGFTGIGLSDMTIDSTYNNTTQIAGFSGGGSGSGEIIDLGNRADLGQFNIGDRI